MFDFTPHFTEGWAESQQGESGHNSNQNCVPTSVSLCLMALGYPDFEPQDIVNVMYGPNYVGPTSFEAMIEFIHKHVDARLEVDSEAGNSLGLIDQYGPSGFPMVFLGHCDANGNYVPRFTDWEHASVVLRRSGNWTVLLNSERGLEVGYPDDVLGQIADSCVLVFHRSLAANPSPRPTVIITPEEDDMARTLPCQTATPDGKARSLWLTDQAWVSKGYVLGTVMLTYWDGNKYQWKPLTNPDGGRGQLVTIISFGYDVAGLEYAFGINDDGDAFQYSNGSWLKDS